MSHWTYIQGVVEVSPFGRSQAEKRFILETVLQHLPKVTGSEKDMYTHIVQRGGYDFWSSSDEFGVNQRDEIKMQTSYYVVVEGNFRDREIEQTYSEFIRWLIRLSKRLVVENCLVDVYNYRKHKLINRDDLCELNEPFSWEYEKILPPHKNWCEKIMWKEEQDNG